MPPYKDVACFQNLKYHLIEDLDVEDVLPLFLHRKILSRDQILTILNLNAGDDCRKAKNEKLVEILSLNLPKFDILIEILNNARYKWLANLAEKLYENGQETKELNNNSLKNDESSVEKLLFLAAKGKIPKKPDVFVDRPQLFERLKNLVKKLENRRGFVIVHGMAGSGKSVLAAQVARDKEILGQIFPQIFWINFDDNKRCSTNSSSTDEKSILLSKFHFLYSHVAHLGRSSDGKTVESLSGIDEALIKLPDLLQNNCPKALLVLDDVASEYHVAKFDELYCRFLVTTRNENLAYCINGYKELMPMTPSGFTRQETHQVLSRWVNCPIERLPSLADDFYQETNGHPFFIALVGSLLKTHKNRWNYYYEELKNNKGLTGIKSLTGVNAYKYKSFHDSVSSSLSILNDHLKQKYLELAVFPLQTQIPAKVLSIYWRMNVMEVENLMDQLIALHLVIRIVEDHFDSYRVHNLMHRLLKTIVDENSVIAFHRKLVENYRSEIRENWSILPKDNYIHRFIGYHLENGQIFDQFPSIFLNLKFLYDKCILCGYQSLIIDYERYKNYIGVQDLIKFDEFMNFLDKYKHEKDANLMNLALKESPESSIYIAATKYL